MNRFIGTLLTTVLIGTGTASVISLVKEMSALDPLRIQESLTLGEEERIARSLALCERQLRGPEGKEHELYCALRDHSEKQSQVFLVCPDPNRALSAQAHLRVLLHPRTIWILDHLPGDWELRAKTLVGPVYIVDFDNSKRLPLANRCELIHNSHGIYLWRYQQRKG